MRLPLWAYALAAFLASMAFGVLQTHRLKVTKAEYSAAMADVRAKGQEAERKAQETIRRDKQAKETTDAQNLKLRSANAALSRSLLDARAGRGYLPPASPGAGNPDEACFSRADLERAIGRLDAGLSSLASEGDQARIDLDSAREWVKSR